MKIFFENLGAIRYAEMQMGKFTVICGMNNSGKTYITYAIYGFLDFWKNKFEIKIENSIINKLKDDGVFELELNNYIKDSQKIIDQACLQFTKIIPSVYSAQEKLFENTKFKICVEENEMKISPEEFESGIKTTNSKGQVLTLNKDKDERNIIITLFSESTAKEIPDFIISHTISNAIKQSVFSCIFPNVFISSAERTGAAIFRQELNFARNRMLDKVSKKDANVSPIELLKKEKLDYALPVEHNVEFTRTLESFSKSESYFLKKHPKVINLFTDILGGEYQVTNNNELFFKPTKKNVRLTMDESSSAVRSLLDIAFYLKHVAKKNDLLMIDEPELNLHPQNQRSIARLLASLVNCGLNVFVTTHSDYFLRELSNLILLNRQIPHVLQIIEREGYNQSELLSASDLKVYVAKIDNVKLSGKERSTKIQTLVQTSVDATSGIQTSCFDETIEKMNAIQDDIIFGG